jgi:hypothetical protein
MSEYSEGEGGLEKRYPFGGKTAKVVGLFAAALISLSVTGCSDEFYCADDNKDLKCDDDGAPVDPNDWIEEDGKRKYLRLYEDYEDDEGFGG